MPNTLANRVAVVSGGSCGIGRAVAVLLAQHGAKVHVCDLRLRQENREVFRELEIQEYECDVGNEMAVDNCVQSILKKVEGVDILINNAGIILTGQIPDISVAEWDACMNTNFKSAYLLSRLFIPSMQRRGGGCIVNISSNAGILPRSHDPVYSTSKGALLSLTRALALSHATERIRVNAVCPGPVEETQMNEQTLAQFSDRSTAIAKLIQASPLARAWGRMISPLEVAQSVLYLVSDAAAMVTGTIMAIDGGKSLGVPPESLSAFASEKN